MMTQRNIGIDVIRLGMNMFHPTWKNLKKLSYELENT